MNVAARILVGSQNYRLDGPDSDYDYKLLMVPDFEDLYNYHKVDKYDLPRQYDPEHYSVMNVMTFDKNIRGGNINALEMLFSCDQHIYNDLLANYFTFMQSLYVSGYVAIVWENFFSTFSGLIFNSLRRYNNTPKVVARAQYFINFADYVANHDFVVDASTWCSPQIWALPRSIRYVTGKVNDEEWYHNRLEELKASTTEKVILWRDRYPSKVHYFDDANITLQNKMRKIVFDNMVKHYVSI